MQTLISLSSLFLALAAAWVNAAPASDGRDGASGSKQTIQSTEESVMSDSKVYMLNALWFKEGGAAAYAEYGQAAGPIVEALGGRRLDGFVPTQALIGDWQPDLLFIVEWPSWETFLQLGQSEEYQKIAHLREVGLENSLLIRMERLP